MKTSIKLYALKTALGITSVLFLSACESGSGGASNSAGDSPASGLARSCTSWLVDSAEDAPKFHALLQPGGSVTPQRDNLDLSFSGTLPAYTSNNTSPIPTAALYSRPLGLEFTVRFKFKSLNSTHPDLGAFISFQNESTGLRWTMKEDEGGAKGSFRTRWLSYGHYSKDTSASSNFDKEVVVRRSNGGWRLQWDNYDENGVRTGGGTSDGYFGGFQLGFGIQNYSLTGEAATGVIMSSIEILEIQTTDTSCDANGFL